MKQNLRNFTSGSQLLENFGLMFAAGLRLPFWITVAVLGLAVWHEIDTGLTQHESYLCWLRLEALGYRYMEFDASRPVMVRTLDGGAHLLAWGDLPDYPPMNLPWSDFLAAVKSGLFLGSLVVVPLFILYYWYCQRFGVNAKLRKHLGGATFASEPFWVQAARMLGVEACMKLRSEGRMTNSALYTELMTADLKHVHKLVEKTIADPITAPEAARMAESVRAVLNTCRFALRSDPGWA